MNSEEYRSKLQQMLMGKKAMVAFNVQNIYHLEALKAVTDELEVPVIAQVSPKYIEILDKHHGLKELAKRYQRGRIFFHLDHCCDHETIVYAMESGFSGVMFDGSAMPLKDNIRRINELQPICVRMGSLIEVELGAIAGVEDSYGVEHGSYFCQEELIVLCKEAKFDLLAVAIGNAHGQYKSTESIRVELLSVARQLCGDTPMVLHGGTGMPDELVCQAIQHGVAKINISTALKITTHRAIERYQMCSDIHDELKFAEIVTGDCGTFFKSIVRKFSL